MGNKLRWLKKSTLHLLLKLKLFSENADQLFFTLQIAIGLQCMETRHISITFSSVLYIIYELYTQWDFKPQIAFCLCRLRGKKRISVYLLLFCKNGLLKQELSYQPSIISESVYIFNNNELMDFRLSKWILGFKMSQFVASSQNSLLKAEL